MVNEHLSLSVVKFNIHDKEKKIEHLYDCISTVDEAYLLAQYAMKNKDDNELVAIYPGWNINMTEEEINKAKILAKEYKYIEMNFEKKQILNKKNTEKNLKNIKTEN